MRLHEVMLGDCLERATAFIRDMLMFEDTSRGRLCVDVAEELLAGSDGAMGISARELDAERIVSDSFFMLPPVVSPACEIVYMYVCMYVCMYVSA
jgi:hypothetical protein